MMRKRAFTLLELLIAISISSFIILGMVQGNRNVMRFLTRTRDIMTANRKVCLLFNQIERDLTTAFIPELKPLEKVPEKKETEQEEKSVEPKKEEPPKPPPKEKDKKKESKQKQNSIYFRSTIYEDFGRRINERKQELLKRITFISTNALQVYGKKRKRLVRIAYDLVEEKGRKKEEKKAYKLYRRETTDLKNVSFKQKEEDPRRQKHPIRSHLVADNIRGVYLECQAPRQAEKGKTVPEGQETISSFVWGKKKETMGIVPQRVVLNIMLWNEDRSDSDLFSCVIPILSYPTPIKYKKKPAAKKEPSEKKEGMQ